MDDRELTVTELGERWPDAAVLWDRDHAERYADGVRFEADGDTLFASDLACVGHPGGFCLWPCRCLVWEGGAWVAAAVSAVLSERVRVVVSTPWLSVAPRDVVAWCEYYVRTELYDAEVCAARHAARGRLEVERREAVPVTYDEIRRSRAFARDLHHHLFGVLSTGRSAARRLVEGWTHEERVACLERAGRWPLPQWPPDLRWGSGFW